MLLYSEGLGSDYLERTTEVGKCPDTNTGGYNLQPCLKVMLNIQKRDPLPSHESWDKDNTWILPSFTSFSGFQPDK